MDQQDESPKYRPSTAVGRVVASINETRTWRAAVTEALEAIDRGQWAHSMRLDSLERRVALWALLGGLAGQVVEILFRFLAG